MPRPLDPTLDVVFKLMFTRGRGAEEALIGLLTSILRPTRPIASLRVLNPQIPPLVLDEKAIVLDILVTFADGTLCLIEMQTTRDGAFFSRLLFYWARAFVEQLPAGGSYDTLRATIGIGLLAHDDARYPQGHTRVGLRRDDCADRQTELLDMHVVNLPRLLEEQAAGNLPPDDLQVLRWAKFLLAGSQAEADAIAAGDPAMEKANDTLQDLFEDEDARMLARSREIGLRLYRHDVAVSRAEGREEGREEGRAEGREEARETLRRLVMSTCQSLGIEIDAVRSAWLQDLPVERLMQLSLQVATTRRWPDEVAPEQT